MRRRIAVGCKHFLFATSALVLFALDAAPVQAQAGDEAEQPADIIVTARRIDERLSDVPISIAVFNQEQLSQRDVTDLGQLATYTPSLFGNQRFGSANTTFSIRGFTQDVQTTPSVGIYFAGAGSLRGASTFQNGDGAGPGQMFDLQNVQVIKGPQGTLFGRNTTGGAILLEPKKPTSEFEGYIEGSIGNYGMNRVQAVLNAPLGNTVRMRLGVDRLQRDGYQKNIGLGPNMTDTDYLALRGSLVVDLTPDIENYTVVSFLDSNSNGHTNTVTDCNPTRFVGGVPQGPMSCAQMAREATTNDFYTVSHSVAQPKSGIESWQIVNTTTWRVSDNLTVKNIFSYGELKSNIGQDAFGTYWLVPTIAQQLAIQAANPGVFVRITSPEHVGLPLTFSAINDAPGHVVNHQSTLTEEFQLIGTGLDDRLQWQAGLYYEVSNPLDNLVGTGGPNLLACTSLVPASGNCVGPYDLVALPPLPSVGRLSRNLARVTYKDLGVYAQATYKLTEQLRFTAGIRYTRDESDAFTQLRQYRFSNTGTLKATECVNSVGVLPDCIVSAKQTTSAPTWVFDLDYHPSEDIMIYAKYSRGYRQGLANPNALAPNNVFGSEKLDAYEAGLKASWRGAVPGSINLAAFYNDFRNQQLSISFISGNITGSAVCACGTSKIYGFELDGKVSPFEGMEIYGAYTYLKTELTGIVNPTPPPGYSIRPVVGIGQPLLLTPEHKWSVTGSYTLPFIPENWGKVKGGLTYSYTGDYVAGLTARSKVKGFGLLNANLSWNEVGGQPVDISLFATNLTNEKYYTYITDLYDSLGFVSSVTGEPPMYGLRVRVRFGS
jgi:iron complex outermembrane receptor protein